MRNQFPTSLTTNQVAILDYLTTVSQPVSTKTVQSKVNRSYDVVSRDLRTLVKVKCVKRSVSDVGHQFLYSYITHDAKFPTRKKEPTPVDPFKPDDLIPFAVSKADNGWNPKVLDRVWNLTTVLGRLIELDALSAISGDKISSVELGQLRMQLEELRKTLADLLLITQRLLETDKVWSNKLAGFFTQWAMDNSIDVHTLLSKAQTIKSFGATLSDE